MLAKQAHIAPRSGGEFIEHAADAPDVPVDLGSNSVDSIELA
jgi:hypothetical protein